MKNGNEMSREELISALKNALNECSSIAFKDIEGQEQLVLSEYELETDRLERKTETKSTITCFFASWFIFGIFVDFFTYVFMNADSGSSAYGTFWGLVIAIVFTNIRKKRAMNKQEKMSDEKGKKMDELEEKRKAYLHQHPEIFGFIPDIYVDSNVIAILLYYVTNMRADNLKEALNLFEQERAAGIF
ncbi:hypothetical protein [Butyrivibrio sp. YAB3001]|uniref:hypothetical protein n=1 Tax=Butyrivibrio sp. YAB3001 TaxID=1520812 RepID=UPI0008F67819|nr:hypothetical protein [Butyrivibrio sp. YAB3001]SFC42178.1 hypothetical protein SAMN02910398_02221 [Butyrivibrio sp. YAB3001]